MPHLANYNEVTHLPPVKNILFIVIDASIRLNHATPPLPVLWLLICCTKGLIFASEPWSTNVSVP